MHLSAQEEYGLRCLVHLARHRGPEPLTIPEIAAAEGLGPEYTAKLMRVLRQEGLVVSTRGAGGGYQLVRPPAAVTAWEALEALEGPFFPESFCDSHSGQRRDCVHTAACSIRGLWRAVNGALGTLLRDVTLADLAAAGGESAIEMRFKVEPTGRSEAGASGAPGPAARGEGR